MSLNIFLLILHTNYIQNPGPRRRIIPLNKDIKSVNQQNRRRINKQSKPQVAKFMLMRHHAQHQKHNKKHHIYQSRPRNRHQKQCQ